MSNQDDKSLQELAQLSKSLKDVPFEVVIRSLYQVEVEKFVPDREPDKEILASIVSAMKDACRKVQANPIERPRPNEVGNDMEPFVIRALQDQGLDAAEPKTRAGKGQSAGYPDVRIETTGLPVHLEVKTYAADSHSTAFRSFFLSPSDDPKVFEDGHHLLVGFEIERNGNFFIPVAFEIVDLFGLKCDLKSEFNSDNRRIYQAGRVLARKRI